MTRSLNVMPKAVLLVRNGKSEASVTIIKDSARVMISFEANCTVGYKASRGFSAIAELLVLTILMM